MMSERVATYYFFLVTLSTSAFLSSTNLASTESLRQTKIIEGPIESASSEEDLSDEDRELPAAPRIPGEFMAFKDFSETKEPFVDKDATIEYLLDIIGYTVTGMDRLLSKAHEALGVRYYINYSE
ncbi:hypothetical protein QR680_010077 [Steinernema hermaphroditum]|uniref:Uncharacterized protein n=1 Tax=Steinernema hermaphroditum TaxID=289476 RepID=A0AA39MB20_9BILA|nr:hypothetical protein QR680_010077 [Steinernema hermaphroditum]